MQLFVRFKRYPNLISFNLGTNKAKRQEVIDKMMRMDDCEDQIDSLERDYRYTIGMERPNINPELMMRK